MPRLNQRDFGHITISDPGADKPLLVQGTLCCCHCGKHWVPRPGSGTVRGFCTRCMGPVCGPACAACVPIEQYLDNIEKGRPEDFVPAFAFVDHAPPSGPREGREIERLQAIVQSLADRVAAQSELLSRQAEKEQSAHP